MSKQKNETTGTGTRLDDSPQPSPGPGRWLAVMAGVVVLGGYVVAQLASKNPDQPPAVTRPAESDTATASATPAPGGGSAPAPVAAAPPASNAQQGSKSPPELMNMEVAKAVMVTVELDFGPKVPTIAEALRAVERRYKPDDGRGRTFAILDAYGEQAPDGKLHMSMHVSSEKPGMGSLVFRRTGELLWQCRIMPVAQMPPDNKNLVILLDNGKGQARMLDGSHKPASILDTKVNDLGVLVRDFWPDGAERELTFIYSACGCPVKVMAKRTGDRTVRTKDLPVIFPDDPAAVQTIARLMRW